MEPVSLDAALLRLRFPDLVLRPGMQVVARVASRGEGARGAIVLAGSLLSASLPAQVQKGDTLRLTVAETSAERVVLRLDAASPGPGAPAAQGTSAPAPAAPAPAAPAPGAPAAAAPAPADLAASGLPVGFAGAPAPELRADPDLGGGAERSGRAGARAGVRLAYETAALGRLDVRLERGPEGVTVVIGAPASSAALARERAGELREALEAGTGAPAAVRVDVRRDPFDAYA